MSTILDFCDDEDEFERMLDCAQANVRGESEEEFIDDLVDKLEEYGEHMYLSDAQYQWLKNIAER